MRPARRPYAPRKHAAPTRAAADARRLAAPDCAPASRRSRPTGFASATDFAVSARRKRTQRRRQCPKKKPGHYNPLAPERVQAILDGLNQMYPGVDLRAHAQQRVGTGGGDDSVGAVYGRPRQHGDARTLRRNIRRCSISPRSNRKNWSRTFAPPVFSATNQSRWWERLAKSFPILAAVVPQTMEELLTLPGVARKTANVVLGTWFKKNEGVVVDTHVTRISRRLELTQARRRSENRAGPDADRPARTLDGLFSPGDLARTQTVRGARSEMRRVRDRETVPRGDKTWSTVEIHKNAKL